MKCAVVKISTVRKYRRMDPGFFLGQIDRQKGEVEVETAERQLKAAKTRLRNAKKHRRDTDKRIARMIREGEIVPFMDINTAINSLTREQLVELLTNYAGIQCYDEETDDVLREALRVNVADETIAVHEVMALAAENAA